MKASILFVMALGILHSTTAQKSAKHFQHTLETTASAADIWRIWTDVDRWPTWDIGLQQAALAGPFARKLGKGYRKMLPEAMQRIKQQVESR